MRKVILIGIENDKMEELRALDKEGKFQFIPFSPSDDLSHTVNNILALSPDSIVSEYGINAAFTGNDIVSFIKEKLPFLPCFILTDNVSDSMSDYRMNVNIIYEYSEQSLLFSKIEPTISYWKKRVNDYLGELRILTSKQSLSLKEEERVQDIHRILSKQLPDNVEVQSLDMKKFNTFQQKTESLIGSMKELLEEIKKS